MTTFFSYRQIETIAVDNDVSYEIAEKYCDYVNKCERTAVRPDGRMSFRDSTRSKTYKAENEFMARLRNNDILNKMTLQECQDISEKVFNSVSWDNLAYKTRATTRTPEITFRKMSNMAGLAYHNEIKLDPKKGNNIYILLHELAHTAGHRHHDVSFRICVVGFVKQFIGAGWAKLLHDTFEDHGLRMKPYTDKKIKPFADWYAGYKRAQVARLARFGK